MKCSKGRRLLRGDLVKFTILFVGVFALSLLHLSPLFAQETPVAYRLGPGDKLRVSVHEWRAARNELFEWSAPKGEFTVDGGGNLSLPVAGSVRASTLTVAELANVISDQLKAKLGLVQAPQAAVEIVTFRPFFILGFVNQPGEYPFRPGMNVLQAISIAGGFYRIGDTQNARFERESISTMGEIRVLEAERLALLAQRARLQAELEQAEVITFPDELTRRSGAAVARMLREEQLLFDSRRQGLRSQIEALEQGKSLVKKEITSLRAKDTTQERQLKLAKKDLENVNSLVSKGLAIAARQLALEQTLAQIESARQDLTLSIIRAEQEINRAERQALDMQNNRRNDILAELRKTQSRISELQERTDTARQLAYESEVLAPKLMEQKTEDDLAQPTFNIIRSGAEGPVEIAATPTDLIKPGDIVTVERPGNRKPSRAAIRPFVGAAFGGLSKPSFLHFAPPGAAPPFLQQ